jgi:hypothetical protein
MAGDANHVKMVSDSRRPNEPAPGGAALRICVFEVRSVGAPEPDCWPSNKMKTILSIVLFTLAATYAFAGAELKFTCENPACKFEAKCKSGGGKLFEQLTGYCCVCKKFVSISWNRKDTPPRNLKTVWVPQDLPGQANLFPCPACTNYVYEFQTDGSSTNRFSCPQCKHHTLKKETLMFYD